MAVAHTANWPYTAPGPLASAAMAEVTAPRDAGDWDGYIRVLVRSFGGTEDDWEAWRAGVEEHAIVRLVLDGNRVVAGATALPVAQWFGGRPVPAAALAAVVVAPEARGRGVAAAMLRALGDAALEAGCLVSPLWASRTTLYRRWGWELAGRGHEHRIPLSALAGVGRDARGEPVLEPGPDAWTLQQDLARRWNGPLERPEWWWRWRYGSDRPHPRERVGWVEDGRLTGLLSFERAGSGPEHFRVVVRELWTATPDALGGLGAVLGSHATVAEDAVLHAAAAPQTPDLAWLLTPGAVVSEAKDPWMIRLLDPAAALLARGWPAAPAARVEVEVDDPWTGGPERMVLEVEGGAARVTPGGGGHVRLGVGALAAWYAGGLDATRAAGLGLAAGPPEDLAALDRLGRDRPAWLPDRF